MTRYLFSSDIEIHNYYYDGEVLDIDDSKFELTGIKKIGSVVQSSTNYSYQGGVCYENYYAVALDNLEGIMIYDSSNMSLKYSVNTGTFNSKWHCNQIFFGNDYYSFTDRFPLLYICMEHVDVHSIIAFRLYPQAGEYYIQEISRLELVFSTPKDTIYYPNAFYDFDSRMIYYAGYTENSYLQSDSNKLKYYVFDLPDYREPYVALNTSERLQTFSLPSYTATQGGFISHHHLYQTYGFNSKTDPIRSPKMRVIDLHNHTIIKDYPDLGALFGIYEEFEHVAINNKGKMISLGNPFNIYEFEFEEK